MSTLIALPLMVDNFCCTVHIIYSIVGKFQAYIFGKYVVVQNLPPCSSFYILVGLELKKLSSNDAFDPDVLNSTTTSETLSEDKIDVQVEYSKKSKNKPQLTAAEVLHALVDIASGNLQWKNYVGELAVVSSRTLVIAPVTFTIGEGNNEQSITGALKLPLRDGEVLPRRTSSAAKNTWSMAPVAGGDAAAFNQFLKKASGQAMKVLVPSSEVHGMVRSSNTSSGPRMHGAPEQKPFSKRYIAMELLKFDPYFRAKPSHIIQMLLLEVEKPYLPLTMRLALAEAEQQRLAEQQRRVAEEQRLAEQQRRVAEEQRLAEQQRRVAEEQRLAEQQRRVAEEQRLAEQQRRVAEEQRRRLEKRKRLAESEPEGSYRRCKQVIMDKVVQFAKEEMKRKRKRTAEGNGDGECAVEDLEVVKAEAKTELKKQYRALRLFRSTRATCYKPKTASGIVKEFKTRIGEVAGKESSELSHEDMKPWMHVLNALVFA